ncbi:MAG: hypothetical protein KAU21_00665 [Gammaproteobacteria bacterium]|nr:hypothetical protein [Gammaproteobacteria bacterium]
MTKTILLLTACAALLTSNITFAGEPPDFKGADSNGDGAVDAKEFNSLELEPEFAKVDVNGDGKLSKGEYQDALEVECD